MALTWCSVLRAEIGSPGTCEVRKYPEAGRMLEDAEDPDSFVEALNSQANEQANSSLKRIATQVHYMNGRNALRYVKQYLAARNMEQRCNLTRRGLTD